MDPFRKLPQDLRFNLLVSLDSLAEVVVAAQASRALLEQFRESRASIVHRHVLRDGDLNGDILQDALAILKFPRPDATATTVDAQQRVAVIDGHLRKWGAKEVSDPFHPDTRDIPTMLDLHNLCRQMWLYIGDYLSKATSRYLPRAYRRLPPWSHPHLSYNPTQIQLQQDVNKFDGTSLGHADRRKILQAFLRHELLYKIYGPVGGESDTQHDEGLDRYELAGGYPLDAYPFDENDPFCYWYWDTIYRYEEREPDETALQLLPCVREYVLAMYGALIADQVRAPVPAAGEYPEYENAPSSGMGRFPDCSPDNESEDLHHLGDPGWSDRVVSLMATAGFDLLTTALTSSSDEFVRFLVNFNKEVLQRPPHIDATNVNPPLSPNNFRRRWISWHCNAYIRLNRQRAWPLFGDAHQCPQIPSVDEYGRIYGPRPRGGLGWGLKADCTKNERIAHGQGTMAYPSLIPKLVPFWEQRVAREVV